MIGSGSLLAWTAALCLFAISISLAMAFFRLLRGPSLPDRIVSLDLIAYQAIAVMLVYAIATDKSYFLEVSLVLALIAFLGTVAFARYVEYISLEATVADQ
ncbi:MAG: pesticidal protein Cry22Aa [Bacteroidetes bacterium]|jgi:multicomponent Na+:H+ antiporter subunit F|nr:pesticidal protein Cry22Aa [Bacteroidota bacterium]